MLKTCKTCAKEKEATEFVIKSRGKDWSNPNCLGCRREYKRKWYSANRGKAIGYVKKWYENNPEKASEVARDNSKNHRERINRRRRQRRTTDPKFKLECLLRGRIRQAISSLRGKPGSAVRDAGCSMGELKLYLEHGFTEEMSWENHGEFWELDHIVPLAAFDLTDREQFLKACHYTNLQPLSKEEHKRKTKEERR